ncbi:GlxA family transcriptional regulator [Agromyces marinus]|uniref:Transcription regulator, AraC family protein n=1 Tax=Agromyces marinus TaxID=1389020 RepID=A0ABM8GYZ9_9MICO|nr:helix-turn-helix domain-containing protein [Agromyces marinus]UIP58057.1 HTH-type transcriptional regulator CdhR [Agromyces marinus]BDZ53724.1 putative transcription regulator, AraC family protein [Agromyces marinus]
MLRTIACIALPQMAPFEFGVICEVFGIDRTEHGGPTFDFHVVAAEPGPIPTKLGFDVLVREDLTAAETADLVAVPASLIDEASHPEVLRVIRDAVDRGAWVLSVCSGAFTLGRAGVLDGRRSTTHWMYTDRLAEMFPATEVDPDVLFVQDGHVVTGAGTAAGIDAALHIVRTELGATAANIVARRMVVPPQRDGGQSQFIRTPVVECRSDSLTEVTEWMLEHLDEDLTVDRLARKALMSPRTFARRFRAETGTTPNAWLNRQRLLRAQQFLEETGLTLEEIARETGFGAAAVMRHHFVKVLQTTPTQYRKVFGPRQAG